jgi:hypothetical protein
MQDTTLKKIDEIQSHSLDWSVDEPLWPDHPPSVGEVLFELGIVLAGFLTLALAARIGLALTGA